MLLSRRHGYLYVHVYKVAGQSVKLALRREEYRHLPLLRTPLAHLVESPMAYTFRPLGPHASARELRDWLGEEEFASLFKFTFVRNPWDWQVSLYHFIQQNKLNHQRRLVQGMRDFDEYIEWRVNEDPHTQSEYLCDRHGELLVDFVGRYEQLKEDFDAVCRRLGLDLELPHVNATKHRDFRTYYSDRSRKLVQEAFAEDIERFGYTFD